LTIGLSHLTLTGKVCRQQATSVLYGQKPPKPPPWLKLLVMAAQSTSQLGRHDRRPALESHFCLLSAIAGPFR
jgi:hypothetical protein